MPRASSRAPGRVPGLPALALAFASLGLSAGCGTSQARRAQPNILLISIDTLRADHLSTYGHLRKTSPFIDSLAAQGIRFDRAYATSSWTTPSVVSMLTSTYQNRHGMGGRVRDGAREWSEIPTDLPHLGVAFKAAGYRTWGLVANTNLAADRGFGRGFDRYVNLGTADLDKVEHALRPWLAEIGKGDEPWFLWVHLLDPHAPYNGRQPWLSDFLPDPRSYADLNGIRSEDWSLRAGTAPPKQIAAMQALYDSEIRDTDEFLKRLFEHLPGSNEAFVLLTADHGEEFLEHGGTLHGRTLYNESIHIPFIVRPSRPLATGQTCASAVSLVDVLPTLLGAAGAPVPPGAAGQNVVGPEGASVPAGRVVFAELLRGRPERAATDGRYKIVSPPGDASRFELYDLLQDPREHVDVAARFGERVSGFVRQIAEFEQKNAPLTSPATPITPEQMKALEALGYVDRD